MVPGTLLCQLAVRKGEFGLADLNLVGFRSGAGVLAWLAVAGILMLLTWR